MSHASAAPHPLVRVASNSLKVERPTESVPGLLRRSSSEGAPRRGHLQLSPNDLAELYELHERRMQRGHYDEKSEAQLGADWNKGTGYLVYATAPKRGENSQEEAHTIRSLAVRGIRKREARSILQEVHIGLTNAKGNKCFMDRSIGQDFCSIALLEGGWEAYFVFDGHGPEGDWPARRAMVSMPHVLNSSSCRAMLKQSEVGAALAHAFHRTQEDLENRSCAEGISLCISGCCAAAVVRHPSLKSLWVATVGDCRVALLVPGSGLVHETKDHKPSDEVERDRISGCGGEIRKITYSDGEIQERVYLKGANYPGLMMTRSLGDVLVKSQGVVGDPHVVQWSLEGYEVAWLLVASDGVWEFMETDEVSEFVLERLATGQDADAVVHDLKVAAAEHWAENDDGDDEYCDDITAMLVPVCGMELPKIKVGSGTPCCGGCWY